MVKRGVDDAIYCEACGAHRDQLGLAGDEIRHCPDCGRATCSNCWNQAAGACLTCRAFALPLAATARPVSFAPPTPLVTPEPPEVESAAPKAVAAAIALAPRPTTPRRFKRAAKLQPDPVVTLMPGVVEPVPVPTSDGPRWDVERFGKVRIGRVIRATAIGSVLAISIGAVGFAGVLRLGPTADGDDAAVQDTVTPRWHSTNPDVTHVAAPSVAPTDVGVPTGPRDPGQQPGPADPAGGGGPTGGVPAGDPPPATIRPTATPAPTADPTATPTASPTDEPTPTPDPPTPTPDPPTPTPDPPTPTPDPPTPTPDPPTPTPDPPTPEP